MAILENNMENVIFHDNILQRFTETLSKILRANSYFILYAYSLRR